MKSTLFSIALIFFHYSYGQINIDSLYNEMIKNVPTKKIENTNYTEITYQNKKSNSTYQFSVDKTGIVENIWGISLTIEKLDTLERPIEICSYGKNGIPFGADSPPIVKIKYNDIEHSKQTDYYNADLSFSSRIEIKYDSIGRERAIIGFDKNLIMTSKQTTDYLDSEDAKIKKFYDTNNQLLINKCGVSIYYSRKHKIYGFEMENKYFDKDLNLVDCTHDDPEIIFAYNLATQIGNTNEWTMTYYNKKGKVVKKLNFKTEE